MRPGDADAAADYHHRCFTATFATQLRDREFSAPDRDATRRQLRDWFRPGSGFATRVAVVDDTPIGHVTVTGPRLVHLFVDPDHQGAGLGRRLLAIGETMITDDGHTCLELHARVDNHAAISFYEAAGWTVTDRLSRTVEHGMSYVEHVLVKRSPAG